MGILIGFRKNLEANVPKHASDVRRRILDLESSLNDAREEERWLLSLAGAAGINIEDGIYLMDATASDADDIAA